MKRLNPKTLPRLTHFSMACLLAATLTACGGGTSTGDADGENGGGDQGLLGGTDTTDTDGDGLADVTEEAIGTNPLIADSDSDGLTDGEEWNTYFTDPTDSDSDNDGNSDGDEVALGGNPNDASDGTPDSGNTDDPEPTADQCDDLNSSTDEWIDNCELRRFGTYAQSAYSQGVQRILWCQGFDGGVTDINTFADGAFGPQTAESVRQYQEANGLLVDGIVGPETWGSLFSKLSLILTTSTTFEEYAIDGCNLTQTQFYRLFDTNDQPIGWRMSRTPGSTDQVEFGSGAPY
ncbi:MAG: peptidoglycan-binding protein [Pseudomonadota bacterium]